MSLEFYFKSTNRGKRKTLIINLCPSSQTSKFPGSMSRSKKTALAICPLKVNWYHVFITKLPLTHSFHLKINWLLGWRTWSIFALPLLSWHGGHPAILRLQVMVETETWRSEMFLYCYLGQLMEPQGKSVTWFCIVASRHVWVFVSPWPCASARARYLPPRRYLCTVNSE